MLTNWIALLLLLGDPSAKSKCAINSSEMLALNEQAFDQGDNGWRILAKQECFYEAAEIIKKYRDVHRVKFETTSWMHEAQMRAYAGDYDSALSILPKAKHKMDGHGWNSYIDATMAFLKRDRIALFTARNQLARTPLPNTHQWLSDDKGKPVDVPAPDPDEPWPPNLNVVDALIRCFDQPYSRAYGSPACYDR